jgi:glycosyltransferase involved in cell wall biosynthesis
VNTSPDLVNNLAKTALFTTSLAAGGAEKSLIRLARILISSGTEVVLVIAESGGVIAAPEGIRVHYLSNRGPRRFSVFRKLWLAFQLRLYLERNKHQLIISTLPTADEIVAISRFPNTISRIANLYGLDVESQNNPRKRARRLRRYKNLYQSRRLVCTTEYMASHMRENFGSSNVTVIHNFLDDVCESQETDLLVSDEYCIHIGRFMPQKRHNFLLRVWSKFPNLPKLLLLTKPSLQLQTEIERLNLIDRVTVVDYVQNPLPLIRKSQCLILCSAYEGFPSVLIEAMHVDTRIASGPCGGVVSELCRDVPEVICDDSSVDSFGLDVERVLALSVPDYASTMQRYSKERALTMWTELIRRG